MRTRDFERGDFENFWDFERGDFENLRILSEGILRTRGFCASGDCELGDFENAGILCGGDYAAGILYQRDFVRGDCQIEPLDVI